LADDTIRLQVDAEVEVRDQSKRELDMRIVPWGVEIDTTDGVESFERGAFDDTDPTSVFLMGGLEHEAKIGLGQTGQPILTRHPSGKSIALENRPDGQHATFRVARTAAGDEQLALAADGIVTGVSVEFARVAGGTETTTTRGRRHNRHRKVNLRAVSLTYRPAYADARVTAVRSEEEPVTDKETPQPPDEPEEPENVKVAARSAADQDAIKLLADTFAKPMGEIVNRLEGIEERMRSSFTVPGVDEKPKASLGQWAELVVKTYAGEPISDELYRTVADVKTTDSVGVVPPTYLQRMIGVIDASRPFISSVERLETPDTGTQLIVPKITQRPTVATQSTEKTEVSSQKSIITTETFSMITKAGVGDLSLQLLRRSSPSFLELWIRLLAEAYAQETEEEAVLQLIAAVADGGPEPAGALDPNNTTFGPAFEATFNAMRRAPDTIWLSSEAVGEFIDAKADGTNAPLYSDLAANFTAGGGTGGTISGLRPVHVPALDTKGAYAIVGPRSGFAFAEEGTFTLETVIASKLGRDVALAGFSWYVPWYPAAFTLYNVAS
jgi:HK97 family phage prohead protease